MKANATFVPLPYSDHLLEIEAPVHLLFSTLSWGDSAAKTSSAQVLVETSHLGGCSEVAKPNETTV